jgi:hypothetical protein
MQSTERSHGRSGVISSGGGGGSSSSSDKGKANEQEQEQEPKQQEPKASRPSSTGKATKAAPMLLPQWFPPLRWVSSKAHHEIGAACSSQAVFLDLWSPT